MSLLTFGLILEKAIDLADGTVEDDHVETVISGI